MKVSGPPAWLALPVITLLVAVILAGPAEMMGRCFRGPRAVDRLPQHLIRSFSASVSSVHVLPSSPHGRLGAGGVLAFLALATGVRMRVVYAVSGVVVVGMILGETLTGAAGRDHLEPDGRLRDVQLLPRELVHPPARGPRATAAGAVVLAAPCLGQPGASSAPGAPDGLVGNRIIRRSLATPWDEPRAALRDDSAEATGRG